MTAAPQYDVAIIGAGLSGLAAAIRSAHFGRRVCLLERHSAVGGLNSFYGQGGRKYDVGLHAVTNYVPPGTKGTPLGKILRQLRIEREEIDLCPQRCSRVSFGPRGERTLRFSNDFSLLESEVATVFPKQADGFRRLSAFLRERSLNPEGLSGSARAFLREHIDDPVLEDMLLCPILYYGSAREHDADLDQFAILFRAIYFEGFCRPFGGIRIILRVLTEKLKAAGGERRMNCGVKAIISRGGRARALVLDSGEEITATHILSCAGADETDALIAAGAAYGEGGSPPPDSMEGLEAEGGFDGAGAPSRDRSPGLAGGPFPTAALGAASGGTPGALRRLAFVETMAVFNRPSAAFGWGGDTIVFFNDSDRFSWEEPAGAVDLRSGVACFPDNFDFGSGRAFAEGMLRCTCLARYGAWAALPPEAYREEKRRWFDPIQASALRFLPPPAPGTDPAAATVATDMFTPTTVVRYTGHAGGAIYGSPVKRPDGRTALGNVHLIGTDQGMLGITGSLMSGIALANRHILHPA